jgi:hypothetical protein
MVSSMTQSFSCCRGVQQRLFENWRITYVGPVERAGLEVRGRSLYHDVRMQTREPLLGVKRVHRGGLVRHLIAVCFVSQGSTVLVDPVTTYYTMMKI